MTVFNWTEAELADYEKRRGFVVGRVVPISGVASSPLRRLREGTVVVRPPHQQHVTGRMNKTEAAYAEHLTRAGLEWKFEAMKLRLADRTWYCPDFLVIDRDLAFHEVKGGFIREDAWIKFKVAREQFPMFRFVAMQNVNKVWRQIG